MQAARNFSEQYTTRPEDIFLVRAMDTNHKQAWYYVAVRDRMKREIFRKQSGVASLKITDFGEILYSGLGLNPPEWAKKLMEKEYGFKG